MTNAIFEQSPAWQNARRLVNAVYRQFQPLKDYSFRDQILRCTLSIMNNIAEGMERSSQKELRQFLMYAKGSCGELQSMLIAALDIQYIDRVTYEKLFLLAKEESKIIYGFIRSLENQDSLRTRV